MSEQALREKVIKGLKACNLNNAAEECDCPYQSSHRSDKCIFELHVDALALLKEQEPRVMTPVDVIANIGAPVWLETWNGALYKGWALIYDRQTNGISIFVRTGITQPNGHVYWLKELDYGKTWRCWTAKPTDAQREAVEWDDTSGSDCAN